MGLFLSTDWKDSPWWLSQLWIFTFYQMHLIQAGFLYTLSSSFPKKPCISLRNIFQFISQNKNSMKSRMKKKKKPN